MFGIFGEAADKFFIIKLMKELKSQILLKAIDSGNIAIVNRVIKKSLGRNKLEKNSLLLLGCLKTEPKDFKINRLQAYSYEDWLMTMETANQQRMLPILYHTLKDFLPDLYLPFDIAEKMRSAYHGSAVINLKLYKQLLKIVDLFDKRGIEVILLKGAHLAEAVYVNIALRPMSDIDLLVKKNDLPEVHKILLAADYGFKNEKPLSDSKHLAPYVKQDEVSLEVHFHITNPPYSNRISLDDLWKRSRVEKFENTRVRVLSPEDLLIHLCLHAGIQHGFEMGLITCYDIVYTLEKYNNDFNWDSFWNRSEALGIDRSIHLFAELIDKLLGIPLPEQFTQKKLHNHEFQEMVDCAERAIFEKESVSNRNLARLFERRGLRSRLSILKRHVLPPGDLLIEGAKVPENSGKLHLVSLYLRRIRKLYGRHGKTLWLGFRGNPETMSAIDRQNKRNKLRDWMSGSEE
jgi:hypothetical protein